MTQKSERSKDYWAFAAMEDKRREGLVLNRTRNRRMVERPIKFPLVYLLLAWVLSNLKLESLVWNVG